MAKNFIKSLTVENGMVKLYHYSDKKITSGFISVNKPYNVHSQNEFTAWGKSRSFFYVNEDGYRYDKGIKPKFLYVCYIPVTDIYPINDNPYKYEKFESDLNQYDSYFKQSWDDGFTAWGYFLGGNKKAPIIVSFIDLPISESYKFSKGGLKVPMEDEELDYRIGSILIGDEKYFVMQKGGYPLTLLNCYLTDERNPKKAMKSYQKTLEVYMWDDLLIDKEFIKDYIKDLKKSKIWRKRLSESNLKLRSRAKEQEDESIKFYSDKILNGDFYIPDNILFKLPNNIKERYVDFISDGIEKGYRLTSNEFNFIPDNLKIRYIENVIKNKWTLKDEEFDYASDILKLKYIKMRNDNLFKVSEHKKEWYNEYKKNNLIESNLKLRSRAKEQDEEKKEIIDNILKKPLETITFEEIKNIDNITNNFNKKIMNLINEKYNNIFEYKIGGYYDFLKFKKVKLFHDEYETFILYINIIDSFIVNPYILYSKNDSYNTIDFENNQPLGDMFNKIDKLLKENNLNESKEEFKSLDENLKLKSRAKEQELDKQEYLKELINKGIENLTTQELLILVSMGEYEKIFDKIKEDLGALLNYWDTSIITQKLPYKERKDLLFILGKTKVLLQINSILGSFHINRYNVDIKTSSTWGYSYYDMLNKLKKILAEGDITNE